jgi:hypothetical protein
MPKRHDNAIYRLSLRSKEKIKVILSSTTRIGLIVYIKDSKKASSVDYIYIEEDTEVKEITIVDIVTTTYSIRSDIIFIINLNANQARI